MSSSLSFSQKFRYSCTSAGLNIVSTTVATWLLYFWSPPPDSGRPQYLDIGLVGLLLGVGRIWDALIDPVIGHWSDGIQTRWGRRRPFLLSATPVMVLMLALLWTPPQLESGVVNGIYFLLVTTGFYTSLSFISIPYDSSLPEMARTVPERVSLSMWKNILGTMGVLVGVAVAPFLLTRTNALVMGLAVGTIAWLCIYITVTALQESPPQQPQNLKLRDSLLSLLQNKPFLLLGLSTIIVQTAYAMLLTNLPYFVTLIIGRSESQVSWFQGIVVITMILTAPIWNWLVRYYSQRRLLLVTMLGLVVMAMLNFSVGLIPVNPTLMALITLVFLAPFLGGYFILVYAMMGDVVDYDEALTGKRREALYYGIFSLSAGLGVALSTFIVPFLFERYGYTAANPGGVRMVFLVGAGLVFLGAVAFRGYHLDSVDHH